MHNEDLHTELEYFSKEYDEEREIEPGPHAPNREENRVEMNERGRPMGQRAEYNGPQGMNLPSLLAAYLGRSENGQPLQSPLTLIHGGRHPLTNIEGNLPPNGTHLSLREAEDLPPITPMGVMLCKPPREAAFPHLAASSQTTWVCTLFVRWIEDYHLLDGLKMPSYGGSSDEEGDPDNFLHLFEASKRSLRRHISQYISSSRRKEKALELSLLGFSGEHSWPLGEVPLEITLGDGSLTRTEMVEEDKDKTAFFAGKEIRRNLEAYVDDMVIKSTSEEDILRDIRETFDGFRLVNMKLNPKKCSFGVEEGLFLGHFITKQGIRSNPSKVKVVTNLEPPRTLKEVQSLNSKLAALSRFLSKGAEKSLHFFKMIKTCTDKKTIRWTTYAEEAFQRMKELVEILPTLIAPINGKVLVMYLSASKESISVVLLAERGETSPYLLRKQGTARRISKKVVTGNVDIKKEGLKLESIWKLYTDGSSSFNVLGAGLMLISHEGKEYTYALCFKFETTNNEAEYEALLSGLRIARKMEIKCLAIFTDSQLMVNQIKGIFEARQPTIKQYLEKVKEILNGFDTFTIEHVRRNQNKKADALSKLASMTFEHPTKEVLVEVLAKRSINDKEVSKSDNIIKEVHEGSCGFNMEPRSMVVRIIKQEAIPPSAESLTPISKEHNSKDKRKEDEDKEVASIEEAYYRNKLRRYYDTRSSRSRFKLGDFVLLFQGNKEGHNVWEGPHIISGVYERELYKITDASDYSLVQSPKGTSLQG
nr:hypothetical protein [Tanacetum cinerariifolium]